MERPVDQTTISRQLRHGSQGCQGSVDGGRAQSSLFKVTAVAEHLVPCAPRPGVKQLSSRGIEIDGS
ncbi:MAG: hypothetical protein RBU30_08735 [Polyangia bacterium]|nr:hypothetical protein [Polyangia bacterium]